MAEKSSSLPSRFEPVGSERLKSGVLKSMGSAIFAAVKTPLPNSLEHWQVDIVFQA